MIKRIDLTELYQNGLQYDTLTKDQLTYFKEHIWNGVGSREYFLDPPDSIFKEPSKSHDFWYFSGGTDHRRKLADLDFYYRCLDHISKRPNNITKPWFYLVAWVYYQGLKRFSKKAWEYYPEPAKTWDQFMERVFVAINR